MAQNPNPSAQIPTSTTDALARLNDAANELGVVVADLRTKISTDMTQDDVDAVNVTLDGITDRLKGFGKDPSNPVPQGAPLPKSKATKR